MDIAERKGLLLHLSDYVVCKENLDRNLLEQDVILEPMTASVSQQEKKLSSL